MESALNTFILVGTADRMEMREYMEITKFSFPKHSNESGELVVLEALRDIPFEVKRVYYIFNVVEDVKRGFHAHKKLNQVLVCVHGSCKVTLDDGSDRTDITLNDPTLGLFVGSLVWREMYDFSSDAVLLVLASEYYDESDYIFSYEEFVQYKYTVEDD